MSLFSLPAGHVRQNIEAAKCKQCQSAAISKVAIGSCTTTTGGSSQRQERLKVPHAWFNLSESLRFRSSCHSHSWYFSRKLIGLHRRSIAPHHDREALAHAACGARLSESRRHSVISQPQHCRLRRRQVGRHVWREQACVPLQASEDAQGQLQRFDRCCACPYPSCNGTDRC